MPSSTELPRISTPRFGEAALIRAPIPYRTRPAVKQRLRPQMSVSLLAGIMRTAMISRNRVIAACTPVTVVSRVLGDVVDHHVHVRARETADELGKRERSQESAPREGRACRCGIRAH